MKQNTMQRSFALAVLILASLTGCDTERTLEGPADSSAGAAKENEAEYFTQVQHSESNADSEGPADGSGNGNGTEIRQDNADAGIPKPMQSAKVTELLAAMKATPGHETLSAVQIEGLLGSAEQQDDPICRGGWVYETFDCFKEGQGPVCGVAEEERWEDVVEYHGCNHPSFGLTGYKIALQEHREPAYELILSGKNYCKDNRYLESNMMELTAAAEQGCRERQGADLRAKNLPDWKADCRFMTRFKTGKNNSEKHCHFVKEKNTTHLYWSGTVILEEPIYQFRPTDATCGRVIPPRRAKISDTVYNVCRAQEFGREPTNVCGSASQLAWTEPSIRRSDLAAEHFDWRQNRRDEAACSTCDDLPYDTEEHYQAKRACLLARLEEAGGAKLDAQARGDTARAHRATEQEATAAELGRILFESVYHSDLDGKQFLPFYDADAAASGDVKGSRPQHILHRKARARLCQAPLGGHVDPQRMVDEFIPCLALSSSKQSQVPSAREAQERDEAVQTSLNLFANFVQAQAQQATAPESAGQSVQFLIHAWNLHGLNHLPHLSGKDKDDVSAGMRAYALAQGIHLQ